MKRFKPFTVLLLLFLATEPVDANAQQNKKIHIATNAAISPYFIGESGRGIAAELIRESFKINGFDVQFIYQSNYQIQRSLLTKKVAGAYNFPHKNITNLFYTEPVVFYQNIAVTLHDKRKEIRDIKDLKGLSVGVFQNASNFLGPDFNSTKPLFGTYKEFYDQKKQVSALLNSEIEVAILDKNIFDYFNHQLKTDFQEQVIPKVKMWKIFPKSGRSVAFLNEKFRDNFNDGFQKLKKTDKYEQIFQKYIKP